MAPVLTAQDVPLHLLTTWERQRRSLLQQFTAHQFHVQMLNHIFTTSDALSPWDIVVTFDVPSRLASAEPASTMLDLHIDATRKIICPGCLYLKDTVFPRAATQKPLVDGDGKLVPVCGNHRDTVACHYQWLAFKQAQQAYTAWHMSQSAYYTLLDLSGSPVASSNDPACAQNERAIAAPVAPPSSRPSAQDVAEIEHCSRCILHRTGTCAEHSDVIVRRRTTGRVGKIDILRKLRATGAVQLWHSLPKPRLIIDSMSRLKLAHPNLDFYTVLITSPIADIRALEAAGLCVVSRARNGDAWTITIPDEMPDDIPFENEHVQPALHS